RLLALLDSDPALFGAYQRIRVDAQAESLAIVADRLGVDAARDPRPAVAVDAAAAVLTAALRMWAGSAAVDDLAALVERSYDALMAEAAHAAAHEAESARRKRTAS
ncbi:TetR family transcriptional regulator, partial [Streptomyces sp. NPDC059853]